FFWEQDLKTPLAEQAKKLERITFHEKLGTVADKVERVTKLAEWLASEGIVPGCDPALAGQAAELCKADLVTEMVGEFPELQGLIGGYYARAEGLDPRVADAIRDHYKPVGQGDEVPTAAVTVAVSLADKLDNLFSFFKIDLLPTGSKDPFALRRAALGYLQLSQQNCLKLMVEVAAEAWGDGGVLGRRVAHFMFDRLGVQLKDQGVRHDFINASRSWGQADTDSRIDRVEAKARALTSFLGTEDGANLLAGYKRAANILKKEEYEPGAVNPSPEPAEKALIDALAAAGPKAEAAVAAEDFAGAMAALATLRSPIDAFFDSVTVNDADPAKRAARLALLDAFRAAVHNAADFSRIEG
ncbi:MAG: glycine--tRNA ligase subunit beta, partial [Alphaproteobacteria bacterium]|nr:glycine--tRNA ligase subunit beta [Alphaproteobacteria bacterium]